MQRDSISYSMELQLCIGDRSSSTGVWYLERIFNSRDYNGGIRFSIMYDGTNLNLYCQSVTADSIRMFLMYI